jgi:hypothetical protein
LSDPAQERLLEYATHQWIDPPLSDDPYAGLVTVDRAEARWSVSNMAADRLSPEVFRVVVEEGDLFNGPLGALVAVELAPRLARAGYLHLVGG